jgi:hypothetical protein
LVCIRGVELRNAASTRRADEEICFEREERKKR